MESHSSVEFSPGSSGRMTTMGVYIRDLLLWQIVSSLKKMKLPSKHMGVTGETTRHRSDDTARRPPSVKVALSVSFGQRAPHRASTRDSSPVRRTLLPTYDRTSDDPQRSPRRHRSRSREFSDREYMDEDKDRGRSRSRERDSNLYADICESKIEDLLYKV